MSQNTAPPGLGFDRHLAEIVKQTDQLRAHLVDADLSATVPSCPDWTLGQLARHVGAAHRWVEHIVRTRASDEVDEDRVPGVPGPGDADRAGLDTWLEEGAQLLVTALRDAGPDTEVWSWAWDRSPAFWARRMTHETVVHRADAALAAGVTYEVEADVAADTVDEWLRIVEYAAAEGDPEAVELRGEGRSLHLHATDAPDAEWLIEFDEDGFGWRRGHEKATVALRGTVKDLMLAFNRRLSPDDPALEVLGDRELLDFWLERAKFS
ncbi:maleylpyruvate isomerase family mycothiol-dependent enzyme [Streptomyces sp. NPDC060194]|uniref:maleylpyruvate isomerase family mycothiol-dependent enzyme n=1 Tax=Streptomyces sp. NPDC060194 TaxID=3347069 RepID=UPI00366523C3